MGCTQSKEDNAAGRELDKELLASSKALGTKDFLPVTPASSSKELQTSCLSVTRLAHSTEHRDSKNRYFPATPDRAPVAPEKQSQPPSSPSKNSNSTKNNLPSSPKSSEASKTSAESLSSSIHTVEYAGQLSVTLANDSAHGHAVIHDPATIEALHNSYGSLNSHDCIDARRGSQARQQQQQQHGNKRRPPKQTSHSSGATTGYKRRPSKKMMRSISPPPTTPSSEENVAADSAEEPTVDTRRSTRSSRTRSSHIPDNESRSPRKKSRSKKKKTSKTMDGSQQQQQFGASISSLDVTDSTTGLDISGSTAGSSSRRSRRTSGATLLGNDDEENEEERRRRRRERRMKREKKEREKAEQQEAEGIQDTGLHQMLLDHPSSHTCTDNDNSRRSSRSKLSLQDSVKSSRTSSSKKSTASSKRSKRSSSDKKKKKRGQKSTSSSSKPKKEKTTAPVTTTTDHSHIPDNDPRMTEASTSNDGQSVLTQGMDGPSQHSALSGPSQHSLQSYLPEMMKSADVLATNNGDSLLTTQRSLEESKATDDIDHDVVKVALKDGSTLKQVNGSIVETGEAGNQKPSSKSRRQSSSYMVSSMVKSLTKKSDNNGRVALMDSDDEESIDLGLDASDKFNNEQSKSSRVMSKVMKQIKKMPNMVKNSDSGHVREGQDPGHTRENIVSDQGTDRSSVQWARNPAPKNINMLEDLAPDPVVFKFDSSDSSIAQFDPTTLEEPGHNDSCTEVDRIHKRHSLKDARSRAHSARDILHDQKEQSLCEGEQKKAKRSKKGRDLPEKHSSRSSTKSKSMRDDSLKDSSMKDRSSRRQRLRLSEEPQTPTNPTRRASRRLSGDVPRNGNSVRRENSKATTRCPG